MWISGDVGQIERTVGGTLRDRSLAATTADTHAVDHIALLGLVSETTGLVGARGARGAVDDVELAELWTGDALSANVQRVASGREGNGNARSYLPAADAQQKAQHVGLLLAVELLYVFEGTHLRRYG